MEPGVQAEAVRQRKEEGRLSMLAETQAHGQFSFRLLRLLVGKRKIQNLKLFGHMKAS